MGEKKFANDPLLFINQPGIDLPKAPMQSQYVSRRKEKELEEEEEMAEKEEQGPTPVKKAIINKNSTFQKKASEDSEEEQESTKPKKQFKEMTTEEKVHYFVETHAYAPKVKCEVKTSRRNYQGFIIDYKDDMVYMQVGRRTSSTQIPFSDIQDIRMIGFS